jgi:hypothetical protein
MDSKHHETISAIPKLAYVELEVVEVVGPLKGQGVLSEIGTRRPNRGYGLMRRPILGRTRRSGGTVSVALRGSGGAVLSRDRLRLPVPKKETAATRRGDRLPHAVHGRIRAIPDGTVATLARIAKPDTAVGTGPEGTSDAPTASGVGVSVLLRQGYSSGGRSRITRTVTPQTTRNPGRLPRPTG